MEVATQFHVLLGVAVACKQEVSHYVVAAILPNYRRILHVSVFKLTPKVIWCRWLHRFAAKQRTRFRSHLTLSLSTSFLCYAVGLSPHLFKFAEETTIHSAMAQVVEYYDQRNQNDFHFHFY